MSASLIHCGRFGKTNFTLWLLTLSKKLKTIVALSHAGINNTFYFWSAGIVNQQPSFAIFQSELYHPHTDKERENFENVSQS